MARRTPTLRDAFPPFVLGLGAMSAAFVLSMLGSLESTPTLTLGGGVFVAATIAAGWLTWDIVQGFIALAAGIAVLPALVTATSLAAQEDPSAPASSALLFVLLAGPGFIAGVIASGIAGRRGPRRPGPPGRA